jgi:glyoxylase-like metal-dependent hydrolase (beta-lactamase superfamily II)
MNRRSFIKSAGAGTFAVWTQSAPSPRSLTPSLSLLNISGSNVLCFRSSPRMVLVDTGPPNSQNRLLEEIQSLGWGYPAPQVATIFNTHYHADETGNNEAFGAAGSKIIAHEHTRQWMSTGYWVPDANRYEPARPKVAQPTETFRSNGSLQVTAPGPEQIDYGHLPLAHTDGDIYVFFRTANVVAVGDVASPIRDPLLDWFTGAWIGGRVDAMDIILKLSDERTRIVPASGPVMSRTEFQQERDMMEEVRVRVWKRTLQGDSPREMLDGGVMNGLGRTWKDPYKFLYDAAKGMFAHHNKLAPAVI